MTRPGPERLLRRLHENDRVIRRAYLELAGLAAKGDVLSPAIEWLLDNYYLICEQVATAQEHLPRGYSLELPRLNSGRLEGLPRVYNLAHQLIRHTDGRIDNENISAFLRAYQSVSPLKLGELWAVSVMLRLALLENLRHVVERISRWREDRDAAREWAHRFLTAAREKPQTLIVTLADFVRDALPMSRPFIAELTANLHGQHAALGLIIHWLEQQLAEQGQTADQLQQAESLAQASDQVSIGNCVTSFKTISSIDWCRWVEQQSVTDAVLRRDPMGTYGGMDFRTRDAYRHVVERVARRTGKAEHEIAQTVVHLATLRRQEAESGRVESHVGYFLQGRGRAEFEAAIGDRPGLLQRVTRALARHSFMVYVVVLVAALLVLVSGLVPFLTTIDVGWPGIVLWSAALLLTMSRPAVSLVNWVATRLVPPRNLARMDYSTGIPTEFATVVVVPVLLTSREAIRGLIEKLEVRYLGNRDPNLLFALLTDLPDALQERLSSDRELLSEAARGIRALNRKYAARHAERFFLFHRPRRWNDRERVWMGWERKRGKLVDFNRFLRTGSREPYSLIVGKTERLRGVRCVITLDADTQLPPATAWKMVATMAHPLNRPVIDPGTRCVIHGYGVLQPRVAISLESAVQSRFSRLYAGEIGIDPYSREVSNVHYDLFSQSQFIGKGVYDLNTFDIATGDRFPENTVLSHDLIEGAYARCGFINDVELIEDHPSRYLTDLDRQHRWIRGDWQIAGWLLPWVRDARGRYTRNPLGVLCRYMIFDNLRRSLVTPSLLFLLLLGWFVVPFSPVLWVLLVLGLWIVPDVARLISGLLLKPARLSWSGHVRHVVMTEARQMSRLLLQWAFLPYEAVIGLQAVGLAVWRKTVSRRRLLEWQTAHDADNGHALTRGHSWRRMWAAPTIAAFGAIGVYVTGGVRLAEAAPLLLTWLLSPGLAWWLSAPPVPRFVPLSQRERLFLRGIARRTWRYFEELVSEKTHWLPPDNLQEHPEVKLAERTSPTNVGMGLLSTLAAWDFGFISVGQLIERTGNTLTSLAGMEQYRGHFFNWYSTATLEPLPPRYVSSVDSGNLTACLIVLREGLNEVADLPMVSPRWQQGLQDTARVLLSEIDRATTEQLDDDTALQGLRQKVEAIVSGPSLTADIRAIAPVLSAWSSLFADTASPAIGDTGVVEWSALLRRQIDDHVADLVHLVPWLAQAPSGLKGPSIDSWLQDLGIESPAMPTLSQWATLGARVTAAIHTKLHPSCKQGQGDHWAEAVASGSDRAAARIHALRDLAQRCRDFSDTDMDFLFDRSRKLLSIGFNLDNQKLDPGYYDLLASEARVASFIGIAQGQLPLEHWFVLSRQIAGGIEAPALVSWCGSMFEYLMPLLYMPTYEATLLHQSYLGAVKRQIHYARTHRIPWGVSESCYNLLNVQKDYQYRAFGVPGLGLKRGLASDLVCAPYASTMALMVMPHEACLNLQRLSGMGLIGRYGLYEAVDYTSSRIPHGQEYAVVRSFMAHHSGMSLLALASAILNAPMQRRFLRDPEMRSATILLQERVTASSRHAIRTRASDIATEDSRRADSHEPSKRVITHPDNAIPDVHILSNGQYHVMVTSAGSGFSRWRDLAVTRWREDTTRDGWGTFFYLRDLDTGRAWSTTWQPLCIEPERYQVVFSLGRAEFRCVNDDIEVNTVIAVSTEADEELRRMTITNLSDRMRTLDLTSYVEVVLAEARAEASHPVFNSLFIETEVVADRSAVLCTRRPRASEELVPWAFHTMILHGSSSSSTVSFETDRARFMDRLRDASDPQAMETRGPMSNTAGAVLDPCLSIRKPLRLMPRQSVVVDALLGVAVTRQDALTQLDRHHDSRIVDRIFDMAWTHNQVLLNQVRITESEARLFMQLAGSILYANPRYRAAPSLIARNVKGQSGLWSYGISGDLPVVLVRIADQQGLELVRQLIQAHAYWRHKGLHVDLVIWTEAYAGYRHKLLNDVVGLINTSGEASMIDRSGGIFARGIDQIPEADRLMFQSVARLVFSDRGGGLASQARRRIRIERDIPILQPTREAKPVPSDEMHVAPRDLTFSNGLGGFTPDGREYVITLKQGAPTPAPWSNVLANERLGTVVTESGGGYTWFRNAHEYRLTPWCNDPVRDTVSEAVYLRDEETGLYWSAAAGPAPGPTPYICRHGQGYTCYEHTQHRIFSEMKTYVAVDAPVKVTILTLRNHSRRDRYLSVTGYCEWVLGDLRSKNAMHVVTQVDPQTGAIFASNAYAYDFPGHVAFFQTSEANYTLTADRTEFLGRNGSPSRPAALSRQQLSNHVGAGLDPCAAFQCYLEIPAGQQREVVFVLGAAESEQEARTVCERFSGIDGAHQGLEAVWQHWKHLLGGIYVETPDASVNYLVNHWLLYQVLSCRFWARSGYYQSGGAFGFRDQLQDAMAFLHSCPWLLRGHLLTCAARQFKDGDVQHWWHPPTGRGVRTHISDDYLWLPYAVSRYVRGTGDVGVLDEMTPFLDARRPNHDEESTYNMPIALDEQASLYDHCALAIRHGMRLGEHGLPLMGWGDWNDGMNHVGKAGRGESVWLAFFLHDVLNQFEGIAELKSDSAFADLCRKWSAQLQQSIETHAWDGRWYLRAFFDDGTPLGSSHNPECRIDLLPQSWAVLSAAGDPRRAAEAMEAAFESLVDEQNGLIRLFTPAFDKAAWDPGYIKGYLPGVRENGGQYTHAAVWAVMAAAALRQSEQAWRLFNLINPVRHGDTEEKMARYRVEPYVLAADVYSAAGHEGRGGWTWYTGSASWMYRLLTEELLGLRLEVDHISIVPVLPPEWQGYTVHYRYRETMYHIRVAVVGPETWNVRRVIVDKVELPTARIPLIDDHRDHSVVVEVG